MIGPSGRGLVVPIDVAALCVGEPDRSSGVRFAQLAARFDNLPYFDASYKMSIDAPHLAESALPDPFKLAPPYERGIHLHWALPDALTRGVTNKAGTVGFPVAPDRWLVVRLRAGAAPASPLAAWVVESDHLWDQGDRTTDGLAANDPLRHNTLSRAIPISPATEQLYGKGFCALGRVFPYGDWYGDAGPRSTLTTGVSAGAKTLPVKRTDGWTLNGNTVALIHDGDRTESVVVTDTSGPTLMLLTPTAFAHDANVAVDVYLGERHTALGYGTPSFAAAYQHCPNVFGFWDPLDDIEAGTSVTVSYLVLGWYSTASRDPLRGVSFSDPDNGRVSIESLQWAFTAAAKAPMPQSTICSGVIRGIAWDQSTSYLARRDATDVDIVIGNTTAEAVAALLAHRERDAGVEDLEMLLECFQLGWLKRLTEPGGTAKADEARYQSHFGSQPGGTLWLVRPADDGKDIRHLDEAIAHKLNDLNTAQEDFDALALGLDARRSQIFADWYRYMLVLHQPAGEVPTLPPQLKDLTVDRLYKFVDAGLTALGDALKVLEEARECVDTARAALDAALQETKFVSVSTGAARYWQPAEPVVLLSGDVVRPSPRYGGDGAGEADRNLTCRRVDGQALLDLLISEARAAVTNPSVPDSLGVTTWSGTPPWIPLFVQWEVELAPQQALAACDTYATKLLTEQFSLQGNIDSALVAALPTATARNTVAYRGSSILAARTEIHLGEQIKRYLEDNPEDEIAASLADIAAQLDLTAMAQALTGFNEALLMQRQILQLPISDPIAPTPAHWWLTNQRVRGAVGARNNVSPTPGYGFNPIRAGVLNLTMLRVVDAFGQLLDLVDTRRPERPLAPPIIVAPSLRIDETSNSALLPPRLAQPSRLQFRWLSAADDQVESNSHPAASPVCGWVLFNYLDASLMVYDADGTALGSLNVHEPFWQGAPGNPATFAKSAGDALENANPHLRSFVRSVRDARYLRDLLDTIDATLTSVNPGGYQQDQGLSLLIGQPLALVRASLRLELHGPAALDQSWSAFRAAVLGGERSSADLKEVEVPVRLGQLDSIDDGLIGYFVDDGSNESYGDFYAAAATAEGNGIMLPRKDTIALTAVAAGDPGSVTVAMLVDPRGSVHATTGILPVKDISLPPQMYSDALQRMAVTFLATPVLRGASVALPLPLAPGYEWQWVAHATEAGWPQSQPIAAPAPEAAFEPPRAIEEGWLKLARTKDTKGADDGQPV